MEFIAKIKNELIGNSSKYLDLDFEIFGRTLAESHIISYKKFKEIQLRMIPVSNRDKMDTLLHAIITQRQFKGDLHKVMREILGPTKLKERELLNSFDEAMQTQSLQTQSGSFARQSSAPTLAPPTVLPGNGNHELVKAHQEIGILKEKLAAAEGTISKMRLDKDQVGSYHASHIEDLRYTIKVQNRIIAENDKRWADNALTNQLERTRRIPMWVEMMIQPYKNKLD